MLPGFTANRLPGKGAEDGWKGIEKRMKSTQWLLIKAPNLVADTEYKVGGKTLPQVSNVCSGELVWFGCSASIGCWLPLLRRLPA